MSVQLPALARHHSAAVRLELLPTVLTTAHLCCTGHASNAGFLQAAAPDLGRPAGR